MISRSQMNRQLYQNGGVMSVARENYGFGSWAKKKIRNLIPNEVADIAVKAAPFVAMVPGGAPYAAAMRGIGRFDQRGSISDAVKQAGATYALAKTVGGDGANIFGAPEGVFGSNANNAKGLGTYQDIFTGDKTGGFIDTITGNISKGINNLKSMEIIESIQSGASSVGEFISKGFNSLVNADPKTLQELFKAATYLAGTTLSYLDQKRINKLREEIQAKFEAAQAGKRAQYNPGEATNAPRASFTAADVVRAPAMNGGRMGYAYGNSVQDGIMSAPQIADQMGMPVGNPRQNQQGIAELDYRDQGGFVPPIGIKEKEDDIPAMLSNNEFVFTAKSVKNADPEGKQDPERGAERMYAMMKQLENGGSV